MELLYKTITGSRLYGINTPTSDTDIKGFAFPDSESVFGIQAPWEQTNSKDVAANSETCIFSLAKFVRLCAKGNPTVLEMAFADESFHLYNSDVGKAVCEWVRDNCITENVYFAYREYINSQIRKLQRPDREGKRQALIDQFGYDTKFAGHAMRLCIQAHDAIFTGKIVPYLDKDARHLVMCIRRGELKQPEVLSLLISSVSDLDKTWESSTIKGKLMNLEAANKFVEYLQWEHFRN